MSSNDEVADWIESLSQRLSVIIDSGDLSLVKPEVVMLLHVLSLDMRLTAFDVRQNAPGKCSASTAWRRLKGWICKWFR